MSFFKDYYKNIFRQNKEKNHLFLYELALKRGKDRGWYPDDWTVNDYQEHLFRKKVFNIQ